MDFEKQKPVSDEYREAWERVFADPSKASDSEIAATAQYLVGNSGLKSMDGAYPNGCPVLPEEH